MTRLIDPADFEALLRCDACKGVVDTQALEAELCACLQSPQLRPNFNLPPSEQRKVVDTLLRSTKSQLDLLEKQFGFMNEDSDGEEFWDVYLPPYLEVIHENLQTHKQDLFKVREELAEAPARRGRMPEVYFSKLVLRFSEIFIEYTGLPVTTDGNASNRTTPPPFHDFAEKCFMALRHNASDGFEAKLHRTVMALRKQGKIPS